MVYRETSAQDVTAASERPFRRFPRPPFSRSIVLRTEKPYLLLIPSPVNRLPHEKLSSTLSTHSIRNAGETARADAFETNASCLFAGLREAVGWRLFGEIFRGEGGSSRERETKDWGLEGKYFGVFSDSSS